MSDERIVPPARRSNELTLPYLTARVELIEYLVAMLVANESVDGISMTDFNLAHLAEIAEREAGKDALKCFALEDFSKLVRAFRGDIISDPSDP